MIQRIDDLTYGDMDTVLQRIGFELKVRMRDREYVHRESGDKVHLSLRPLTEPLAAEELVGVRGSLDWLGIVDRDDFDLLLLQIGANLNGSVLAK